MKYVSRDGRWFGEVEAFEKGCWILTSGEKQFLVKVHARSFGYNEPFDTEAERDEYFEELKSKFLGAE